MSKSLITTLVVGSEIEALSEYTLPTMRAYAQKVGADFKVMGLTDITQRLSPYYEKNQIDNFLDEYDRVLYIDSDILVVPDAPDLFAMHDGHSVMAVSVEHIYRAVEQEKASLNQVLGEVNWTREYFNSGVVLFTKAHRELLNTSDGLIEKWIAAKETGTVNGLNDQSIFNYRVNQLSIPMQYVSPAFNFTKAWGTFHTRFSQYFIHYAGMKGQRLARVKKDADVLRQSRKFSLFSHAPWLVKLQDKIL